MSVACSYGKTPALLVPVLTPFTAGLEVDVPRFTKRCGELLDEGAHGLAVFGTTSEANSLSLDERMSLLEALVQSGIDPAALMPGCGNCAIPDAVKLASHAVGLGCPGVLIMPPFFYRVPSDEGQLAVFSEIIERVGDDRLRIYLYHFPRMSGMPITRGLIGMLLGRYPDTIAGVKDSAGVWEETEAMIREFPGIDIFSGSESFLLRNISAGGAGCISATANANARAIRALIDNCDGADAPGMQEKASKVRSVFEKWPLIPTLKSYFAARGDKGWAAMRPPLLPLSEDEAKGLIQELESTGL